jgi:hypothetical protein
MDGGTGKKTTTSFPECKGLRNRLYAAEEGHNPDVGEFAFLNRVLQRHGAIQNVTELAFFGAERQVAPL